MEEQEVQFEENIEKKSFWSKLKKAITSKTFLINFILSILFIVFIFMGTFYSLDVITHHGEGLSVPDFTGMNIEQVKKVAEDRNLRFKIIDSVWDAPGKKGSVIAQTPPPDFKVKEGRTILLTTKTYEPERIKMPNFTDVSLIQAKADLERYGFKLGKITYELNNEGINNLVKPGGQYIRGKRIRPGTMVEKGSRVDLIVWVTTLKKVPNFKGFNKEQAIQKCLDLGLNPKFVYDDEMSNAPEAMVWKQNPPAGAQLMPGTAINLWMTLDMNKIEN